MKKGHSMVSFPKWCQQRNIHIHRFYLDLAPTIAEKVNVVPVSILRYRQFPKLVETVACYLRYKSELKQTNEEISKL